MSSRVAAVVLLKMVAQVVQADSVLARALALPPERTTQSPLGQVATEPHQPAITALAATIPYLARLPQQAVVTAQKIPPMAQPADQVVAVAVALAPKAQAALATPRQLAHLKAATAATVLERRALRGVAVAEHLPLVQTLETTAVMAVQVRPRPSLAAA